MATEFAFIPGNNFGYGQVTYFSTSTFGNSSPTTYSWYWIL